MLLVGCARTRDPAPEDVDGLSKWVFQHYEDPEVLTEGMANLAVWLDGEGRGDVASDGLLLSDLTEEEVAGVPHPDRDLALLVGVAVPGVSAFPVGDHAGLIVLEDQTWNDRTYTIYTRTITEGDAEAFAAGSGTIRTVNEIDKSGAFGVHIPYTLFKDFTWVDLGEQGRAVVARAWIEESSCAEGGANCVNQTFTIDLWYSNVEAVDTVRMTAGWNDVTTSADSVVSDDERVGLMVNGVHDIFENTDEKLAGE